MTRAKFYAAAVAATFMSFSLAAAPLSAASAMEETTDGAAVETTLHNGAWTKKNYKSSGTWKITEKSGKYYVSLSDDFKTSRAPDLKLFLSPKSAVDADNSNATDGAVLISPLESNKGGQIYEIPAGVDLADFRSILIHCERFSKLWSAADLT